MKNTATKLERVCASAIVTMIYVVFIFGAGYAASYTMSIEFKDSATWFDYFMAHIIIGCFFIGVFFGINSIWDCAAFTFKKWGEVSNDNRN
jgi:ACR3 family arsenite efflux pump ArsB